jgi:hypothetical protein
MKPKAVTSPDPVDEFYAEEQAAVRDAFATIYRLAAEGEQDDLDDALDRMIYGGALTHSPAAYVDALVESARPGAETLIARGEREYPELGRLLGSEFTEFHGTSSVEDRRRMLAAVERDPAAARRRYGSTWQAAVAGKVVAVPRFDPGRGARAIAYTFVALDSSAAEAFAFLLLVDPGQPFHGQLRTCEAPGCGRPWLRLSGKQIYCSADCQRAGYNAKTLKRLHRKRDRDRAARPNRRTSRSST